MTGSSVHRGESPPLSGELEDRPDGFAGGSAVHAPPAGDRFDEEQTAAGLVEPDGGAWLRWGSIPRTAPLCRWRLDKRGAVVRTVPPLRRRQIGLQAADLSLLGTAVLFTTAKLSLRRRRDSRKKPPVVIISDRRAALLPSDPASPGNGALCVRDPAIVACLTALFGNAWDAAIPLCPPPNMSSRERALLKHLADGLTVHAAAGSSASPSAPQPAT